MRTQMKFSGDCSVNDEQEQQQEQQQRQQRANPIKSIELETRASCTASSGSSGSARRSQLVGVDSLVEVGAPAAAAEVAVDARLGAETDTNQWSRVGSSGSGSGSSGQADQWDCARSFAGLEFEGTTSASRGAGYSSVRYKVPYSRSNRGNNLEGAAAVAADWQPISSSAATLTTTRAAITRQQNKGLPARVDSAPTLTPPRPVVGAGRQQPHKTTNHQSTSDGWPLELSAASSLKGRRRSRDRAPAPVTVTRLLGDFDWQSYLVEAASQLNFGSAPATTIKGGGGVGEGELEERVEVGEKNNLQQQQQQEIIANKLKTTTTTTTTTAFADNNKPIEGTASLRLASHWHSVRLETDQQEEEEEEEEEGEDHEDDDWVLLDEQEQQQQQQDQQSVQVSQDTGAHLKEPQLHHHHQASTQSLLQGFKRLLGSSGLVGASPLRSESDSRCKMDTPDVEIIRASWIAARRDPIESGVLLFKGLFTKFPNYLKFFAQFDDLDIERMQENKRLLKHAVKVIDTVTFVVDSIGDPTKGDQLNEALLNLVRGHLKRKIGLVEFRNLGIVIIDFICELNQRRGTCKNKLSLSSSAASSGPNSNHHSNYKHNNNNNSNNSSSLSSNYSSCLSDSLLSSNSVGNLRQVAGGGGGGAEFGHSSSQEDSETMTSALDKIRGGSSMSSSDEDTAYTLDGSTSTPASLAYHLVGDHQSTTTRASTPPPRPRSPKDEHHHDEDCCLPVVKLDTNHLVSAWTKLYSIILDLVERESFEH